MHTNVILINIHLFSYGKCLSSFRVIYLEKHECQFSHFVRERVIIRRITVQECNKSFIIPRNPIQYHQTRERVTYNEITKF